MTPVLFVFFWHNLSQAKRNQTTNETYKISAEANEISRTMDLFEGLVKKTKLFDEDPDNIVVDDKGKSVKRECLRITVDEKPLPRQVDARLNFL